MAQSTEQALSEALNAGVTGALGALQFQVIALTAERDVLKARIAELEATHSYAIPPALFKPPQDDALTRDDARPPAPVGDA